VASGGWGTPLWELDPYVGGGGIEEAVMERIEEELERNKKRWESWMNKHPDPFTSVHRGKDREQLEIGVKDVAEKLSLRKGELFLDAGCGSGLFLSEIIKKVQVTGLGVDFSESHIRFAKENFPQINFLIASVEALPFPSSCFDKILSYSVLHCLDDWKNAIDEFLRVSKKGGKILIGDIPSIRHRYRMYFDSFLGLLSSLRNLRKLREKWSYIEEVIPWNWLDLDQIKEYVGEKGFSCKIFRQPKHRQFESITYHYRFDILIEK
jgi:ubiquinone/menaquinone biosynthesis C-methylase UbiE